MAKTWINLLAGGISLGCLFQGAPSYASRRVNAPMYRLRQSLGGADKTLGYSQLFPQPTVSGLPLSDAKNDLCENKWIIKLQNINSIQQTGSLYLRPGSSFNYWFTNNAGTPDPPTNAYIVNSDIKLVDFLLKPLGVTDSAASLWATWSCRTTSLSTATCQFAISSETNINNNSTNLNPTQTFSVTATSAATNFQLDVNCDASAAFTIVLNEDRGAVLGALDPVFNFRGAFSHFEVGNEIIELNGGRPF